MKLNFDISDFCISDEPVPQKVADKILEWHLLPLQKVRNWMNTVRGIQGEVKVWASKRSCYRPYWWEIAKKRSGKSQHTFGQRKQNVLKDERGATDVTCTNFKQNKDKLLQALIEKTEYTRFAVYNTFIHCDYKERSGVRQLFTSTSLSKWTFIKNVA